MWVAGSVVLILTAALVGMTTSPSDYTVAIVDSACAPLVKSSNAISSAVNGVIDFTASPIFFLSRISTGFLDCCKDLLERTIQVLLNAVDMCLRYMIGVLQTLIKFVVIFPLKTIRQFTMLETVVSKLELYGSVIHKYCMYIQMMFDHFLYNLLVQKYMKTCLDYFIDVCHSLLSFPLKAVTYATDKMLFILKYVLGLPPRCFIWLVKYVLYSVLHPYVCVIYSSCTVGIFVVMIPVLMHVCKITDIRPLIRWICAVAINTESRNRVLDILHRMSIENRAAVRSAIAESEHGINDDASQPEAREECAVCYQSERLVKVIPCGHKTTCYKCLQEIGKINNRCPMCREQIMFIL